MCKACRQRSIWARIKLLSSISVADDLHQRRTHSELKKKMFFVFTSNLSTQFSKFSRSSKLLGHLRFTGYSRLSVRWSIFKEQFVARFELTSLRIIRLKFVLSSVFENIFYSLFSLDCLCIRSSRVWNLTLRFFHCQGSWRNIFQTTRSGFSFLQKQRIAHFNP